MVSFKHNTLKVSILKKRADFLKVASQKNSFRKKSILVSLGFCSNNDNINLKIGLVVTKKIGNAVVRNAVKRRLREALRIILKDDAVMSKLLLIMPAKLVLVANQLTVKCSFIDIVADISEGILFLSKKVIKNSLKNQEV